MTKFVLLKPMPRATVARTCQYLKNEVFSIYGVPEIIHSDNGSQFKSGEFRNLMEQYGIKHVKNPYYAPHPNASERVNRSVIAAIRAYVQGNHQTWDRYLSDVGSALRESVHDSTKYTPHYLMFGMNKVRHGDMYKLLREIDCLSEGEMEVMRTSVKKSLIHGQVQIYLTQAFEKYSQRYNLRTRPVSYNVGDVVYVKTHQLSDVAKRFTAKFAPSYVKGVVKTKLGSVVYEIVDFVDRNKVLGKFHAKDLKV